jgi:8-oxo-dGTP diphosphatase
VAVLPLNFTGKKMGRVKELRQFTIRVYGILLDAARGVLVADEFQEGQSFIKFPGGGLELGEGTRECLAREWMEELNQKIEVGDHFYTTDFYQQSAFDPTKQVISIYYLVHPLNNLESASEIRQVNDANVSVVTTNFRWISIQKFNEELLTFPIDRLVGKMIRDKLLKLPS